MDRVTEKPGDKIGRYKLLQKIGEGGCGVVYMAEQEEPVHRPVALKIIKLGMDTRSVIARFEAERQALALMDHPHIARVFDGGATEVGRPYFVMELVRGVPITKYCDEHRLDLHERLELFVQVCQAVQHAHQKGVIHRDLKPSNILVAIHDDKQVPKVIDFGIAKATHQRLTEKTLFTRFNQLIGTPAYMSPEQAGLSSLDVDTRSDIYSLGVLLYELLTGRTPFSKEELLTAGYEEICRIIREKEPPKPSTRLSTLSAAERGTIAAQRKIPPEKLGRLVRGELDWVVMKALEKDRKRRYESATALAQDMDRFLNHEPVSAVSPSLRYRGMKFARRNRVPLTAASLFLLVLITGAVMSTVQAIRANRNAKEAKRQYQIATNATDQATRFLTQSRHEEGKAWLERADAYLKEKNYFYAKLMAGRAIGFDGFGRASQSVAFQTNFPILLQSQSAEFRAAERVLKREPDYPLLWQSPIQRHLEGYITAIRFSRDGKNLVTISSQSWSNEVFKVWDVSSGRLLSRHELGGFGFIHVSEAAVAPNGKAVATVRGSVMSLVDLASGKETKVFKGHSDQIRAVAFSPDARKLASSSLDETLRIWDLASGRQISELKISLAKAFEMEFSVDGNVLIGNCSDGFVRGWSLTEEKEIFSVRTTEADDPGHRHLFSLSADGRQLVLVKRNLEQAAVWELPSQIELWRPEGEWKGEWTHFVGFSPRDAYLAIANGGQIKLWDLANRKPLVTLSSPGWVSVIAFSPDEKVLAAATEGGSILTWELPSGRKPSDIDAQAEVGGTPIAFSPDGTQLVLLLSLFRRCGSVLTGNC